MIDLSKKIVYLAAPKKLLSSDEYDRAFTYLLQRCAGVINPRWMFANNEDWKENLISRLIQSKASAMVIVSDNGIVGKGVYTEHLFFFESHCPIFHYVENPQIVEGYERPFYNPELEKVKSLQIIDPDNWKEYAKIK
jgi:hypothetical protein